MNSGYCTKTDARQLKTALGRKFPEYSKNYQQDAQELLNRLFCEFVEDAKKFPLDEIGNMGTSVLEELFSFTVRSMISCKYCGDQITHFDSFNILSLPLRDVVVEQELSDCLDAFCAEEMLDCLRHCDSCDAQRHATYKMELVAVPKCIFVHLKRFHSSKKKLKNFVRFPLWNAQFLPSAEEAGPSYQLTGVIYHEGTMSEGHYTSVVRRGGHWIRCDDDKVSCVSEESVVNSDAYILVYERQESDYEAGQTSEKERDPDDICRQAEMQGSDEVLCQQKQGDLEARTASLAEEVGDIRCCLMKLQAESAYQQLEIVKLRSELEAFKRQTALANASLCKQEVTDVPRSQATSTLLDDGGRILGENLESDILELPNLQGRKDILAAVTASWGIQPSVIESLANMTSGYDGAQLDVLCSAAAYKALARTHPSFAASNDFSWSTVDVANNRVTMDDFEAAMRIFQPTD